MVSTELIHPETNTVINLLRFWKVFPKDTIRATLLIEYLNTLLDESIFNAELFSQWQISPIHTTRILQSQIESLAINEEPLYEDLSKLIDDIDRLLRILKKNPTAVFQAVQAIARNNSYD